MKVGDSDGKVRGIIDLLSKQGNMENLSMNHLRIGREFQLLLPNT